MSKNKPEPVKAPFQQQQQTTTTYAPQSVAGTPEAKSFLDVPLDFGDEFDVDPGVARRTDLAEQEAENRANSVFNTGAPRFARELAAAKEQRDIRAQGAAEAAAAQYANRQGNNALRTQRTLTELERKRQLLPTIAPISGSGSSSGYNTQIIPPQPGFLSSFARGLGSGLGAGFFA